MSKNVNACKSDNTENWNKAVNFVPSKGDNKSHHHNENTFCSYRLSPVTTGVTSSS